MTASAFDVKKASEANGFYASSIAFGLLLGLFVALGAALLAMDVALGRPLDFDRAAAPVVNGANFFLVLVFFSFRWLDRNQRVPAQWVEGAANFSWSPEAAALLCKRLKPGVCLDRATLRAVARKHLTTDKTSEQALMAANKALRERYGMGC